MVTVVVGKHNLPHVTQIKMKIADIRKHSIGPRSRIYENSVTVRFHERRETPLADSLVSEHRREDGDFEILYRGVPG
jgi:hypothetical protein